MSQFTLATLKSAVVTAAISMKHQALIDTKIEIVDRKSFVKALRKAYPDKKWDFRTYTDWMNIAEWVGIPNFDEWKAHVEGRKAGKPAEAKLKDLKQRVYNHYQVSDTKALKAKLVEWQVPFDKLTTKAAWQKLWDDVQAHYQHAQELSEEMAVAVGEACPTDMGLVAA